MAERFIKEIYSRAELLYIYRQCSELLSIRDYSKFSKLWSAYSGKILSVVNEIKESDAELAGRLEGMVYAVVENAKDTMLAIELLDGGIIPILYTYMNNYRGIDVTEGEWQLKSSRSGYLTMHSKITNCHIHSLDNPMWEARVEAKVLYDGSYDRVLLFGAGLGYLAKAFWEVSEHSLDIYIFEKDNEIENYAHMYGVVDDICDGKLHYIVKEDIIDLYCEFLNMQIAPEKSLIMVQDYLAECLDEPIKSEVKNQVMSDWALISFKDNYNVNFWRNKRKFTGEMSELINKHKGYEFIVVAAGPSLDDNIDYIKLNVGKKIIVCVNTVLKRMLKEGIKPDYVCLIDPTVGVFKHVEGIEEKTTDIPLIAESVAYWKFLDVYQGPIYRVFGANYALSIEEARRIEEPITDIGSTVANLVIEVAVKLGADRIELIGMDLAFPGERQYAGDNAQHGKSNYQTDIYVKAVDGGTVRTVDTFNIFRADIEKQINRYDSVEFENLSAHGAMILGSFSGGWRKYCLHLLLENKLKISENNYKALLHIGGLLSCVEEGYCNYRDAAGNGRLDNFSDVEEKNTIKDILKIWHDYAAETDSFAALVFLDTVLLDIEYDEDIFTELINVIADTPMDYKGRYFWYCQIKEKMLANDSCSTEEVVSFLNILKDVIVEEISNRITLESTNYVESNISYIFVDQLTGNDLENGSEALEAAVSLLEKGKKILLINTSEKYPIGLTIPIYSEQMRNNEIIDGDRLEYKGKSIPYFQCESCMPDIENIKLMLGHLQKVNPSELMSYTEDSPLVWMIESML